MLIITNPGLVDAMAFHLIGASSKRNDDKTIGFFGSGLKYAIAGLMRKRIPFQVWRGTEVLDITTDKVVMRGQEYERIIIDGVPTSFTLDMGPKWETWMFIRELYANAIDEGGEMAVTDDYMQFIKDGHTTIVLPDVTPELQRVIDEQEMLFCRGRDVIYENEEIKVYDDVGDGGFYVKGIMVHRGPAGFGYELKRTPYDLNEERQVRSGFGSGCNTTSAIFSIDDPKVVRRIVARTKLENSMENALICRGNLLYSGARHSAPAWHKYMFIPYSKKDFAKDFDHLVVCTDVYNSIKHPRKWESAEWVRIDRGQELLHEAVAIIEAIVPGSTPRGEWAFGQPESSALFMQTKNGITYVSDSCINDTPARLAAILIAHMTASDPNLGIDIIGKLISK